MVDINPCWDRFRSLILLERFLYLNKIEEADIASSNLLDRHQHQTILRLYYELNTGDFQNKLQLYFSSHQQRIDLLQKVTTLIRNELHEVYPYYKDFISINDDIYDSRKKITNEFKKIVEDYSLENEIYFANRYGFGIFKDIKIKLESYGLTSKILNSSYSSVGGLMYYSFNINPYPVYCYQMMPIEVLASTLHLYSKNNLMECPNQNWWNFGAHKEMQSLPESSKNLDNILKLTFNVLSLHEQGHDLCVNEDRTLYHFLKSIGVTDNDIYQTDFASDHNLKSWDRVKNGICTAKDVCFLLGDFLANITALIAGIDPQEELIMRAFNWGISSPPSPKRRPRGKISFIRYSLDKNLDNLFDKLELIFSSAINCPSKTEQAMQEMDLESWRILEEYYHVET